MWLWCKITNSEVGSLAGQTVKCYSGEKASVGDVNTEGASWKQRRRINFGRKVKMEAAGKAGVCLAACCGRADPCRCLKVFCLTCSLHSDPLTRTRLQEKKLSVYVFSGVLF